jgi:hypothetical protein
MVKLPKMPSNAEASAAVLDGAGGVHHDAFCCLVLLLVAVALVTWAITRSAKSPRET